MLTRKFAGAAALAFVAPLTAVAAPAEASCMCPDPGITVRVSDYTPASGQTFVARGQYIIRSGPAVDHIVRVQTYRDGRWRGLTGARVSTNDEGRYRVRLQLSQRGKRYLRVVGVSENRQRNEYKRFTVRVH